MSMNIPGSVVISRASGEQNGASGATSRKEVWGDFEAFQSLLIAQLRNQDPTSPQDPAEFSAQLAALSSLEQMVNVNEKLDVVMSTVRTLNAAALLGRELALADGSPAGRVAAVRIEGGSTVAVLESGRIIDLATERLSVS